MIITCLNDKIKKIDEKIILIAIIGNLEAVKNGGIALEEAEKFLFSPHIMEKLKRQGCDEKILELIMRGCELEDVVSLIPEKYNDIMEGMKQDALMLIKKYEVFNESFWFEE